MRLETIKFIYEYSFIKRKVLLELTKTYNFMALAS